MRPSQSTHENVRKLSGELSPCPTTAFHSCWTELAIMSGYGAVGGGTSGASLAEHFQDAIHALGSSIPSCCAPALNMLPGPLAGLLGTSGHSSSLIGGGSGSAGSSGLAAGGTLKLNGRSLNIIRLLGEGGFSFVYLARDKASGRDFALKQVSDGVSLS